jgi:hypothetical protein
MSENTISRAMNAGPPPDELRREQWEWLRVTLTSIGDAVITTETNGDVNFPNPVAQSMGRGHRGSGQPDHIFRTRTELHRRRDLSGRQRLPSQAGWSGVDLYWESGRNQTRHRSDQRLLE